MTVNCGTGLPAATANADRKHSGDDAAKVQFGLFSHVFSDGCGKAPEEKEKAAVSVQVTCSDAGHDPPCCSKATEHYFP